MSAAPVSPQTAITYIMVTMSAADRDMSDAELKKIGDLVRMLPLFRGSDEDRFMTAVQECCAILEERDGLATIFGLVRDSLPTHLRETAYAMAVEVAAADLSVGQEELRLLQMLRDELAIDRLAAAAIERSAKARYVTL